MTDAQNGAIKSHGKADPAVARTLKLAHAKLGALGLGPATSLECLRQAEGLPQTHTRVIARLAFLAPDIQDAILEGRLPPHLNVNAMTTEDVPVAWADQRAFFSLADAI